MIIQKPWTLTKLQIWFPKYSSAYTTGERVALLAVYKVEQASPVIIVEFTKADHLKGQRFCIKREDAMKCPVDSNGKIACYAVPMSKLERWESAQEVAQIAEGLFSD